MANNQYVNKVEFGGNTIIDITPTTAVESDVASGKIFFKADGSQATGSIDTKTSSDLTVSGDTVTAPSGYYSSDASASVASGSVSIPYTLINEPPTIIVSSAGLITSNISASRTVSPNVTAGYITSGTSGNVSVTGSSTKQLSTQAGTTITPTESVQTAVGANKFTTGDVKVGAISSTYVGSGITRRDSTDLTASGDTVSVPSGYYENSASKAVAAGSATTPYTEIEANPTISVDSNGLIESRIQYRGSITPTVVAGYVSSGTSGDYDIDGANTYQLPTQAARTITPSQNVQIAVADGKYTTGIVSVNPIPPEYIIPSGVINITSNGSVNVKQYAIAAVNIPPTIIATDTTPYNYKINSTDSDSKVLNKVIGGTVAWNQLIQSVYSTYTTAQGVKFTKDSSNVSGTVSGTASASGAVQITGAGEAKLIKGHVNYVTVRANMPSNSKVTVGGLSLSDTSEGLLKYSNTVNSFIRIDYQSGVTFSDVKVYPQFFDLTLALGSTIADYIYTLEQTTTGAGVAYFRNLFPKPYYEYNAGELLSVKTSAHKIVGFNQLDVSRVRQGTATSTTAPNQVITDNYIPVFPNTDYYLKSITCQGIYVTYYDASKNGLSELTKYNLANFSFTTPNDAHYIRVMWYRNTGITPSQLAEVDPCINIHSARDGEYEPYQERNYALDSSLELRGIPKLDANNKLYYDGDEYAPDGTVTRKYGIVDLGTLTWTADPNRAGIFYCVLNGIASHTDCMCTKYVGRKTGISTTDDKYISTYESYGGNKAFVRDTTYSSTSAADFKTAMSGNYFVYELATPNTETASQYTNIGRILQGYTETFVDNRTVPMPVGHSTDYLDINEVINVPSYLSSVITPAKFNDVNFYDYDGTIVYSYSASDFANLSSLPANPTHIGLTAMGWNWTLSDAKAQVLISGELDIGQQYKSADGKTHLHIVIANDNTKKPRLYWSQSVANGVTIDWGDGTSTQTKGGTGAVYLDHTYASIGSYDITLTVTSGTAKIGGTGSGQRTITGSTQSNVYCTALKSVVLGDNMGVNDYGFYYQYGIEDIAAFDGDTFSNGTAQNCECIRHITYPKPSAARATYRTYQRGNDSLKTISLSKEVTAISQNGFRENKLLQRVVIPNGVTEIGSYAFYYCTALTKLVIPATVTTIAAYAFGNASCMLEYHFKGTTPPTLADATVFTSIPSGCKIYVPSAALSTYQSANIWSDFSSKMVGE